MQGIPSFPYYKITLSVMWSSNPLIIKFLLCCISTRSCIVAQKSIHFSKEVTDFFFFPNSSLSLGPHFDRDLKDMPFAMSLNLLSLWTFNHTLLIFFQHSLHFIVVHMPGQGGRGQSHRDAAGEQEDKEAWRSCRGESQLPGNLELNPLAHILLQRQDHKE